MNSVRPSDLPRTVSNTPIANNVVEIETSLTMNPTQGSSNFQFQFVRLRAHMRLRAFPIAVMLAALSPGTNLSAQRLQPTLSLSPVFDAPRSHAPVQLDATLSWESVDLLDGRLELQFYVNGRRVHTWLSREVVLSSSELTLPVMLPTTMLTLERDTLNAHARFVTDETTHDLDIHDVLYPVDFKRALTVGIVHPESGGMPPPDFTTPFQDRFAWVAPFRLDDTLPDADWSRHLNCRTMLIDPDFVPDEPLELVAFDLLIVTNQGLIGLDDGQLDAVAGWTEAGGAVCVAGEFAQHASHRSFLARVAGSSPVAPLFDFDDDGNITALLGRKPQWILSSPGIGRAIVTLEPVDVLTPEWRTDVLELWRVRPRQIDNIVKHGAWDFPLPENYFMDALSVGPLRAETASEPDLLQLHLMPERVEGVPLPTVALILAACLFAIAPGDYFLLSLINRRRWTWILFPTIAIGFAIYTVRLARSHMGQADHRNTLTVVDLTSDGRPARTSRFELLFAASEKQIQSDLTNTLVVPLESRPTIIDNGFGAYSTPVSTPSSTSPPGVVTGRVPREYTNLQSLRQWTPQLARYTTMRPDDNSNVPDIGWSEFHAASLQDPDRRDALLNQLQNQLPSAQILLLRRNDSWKPDQLPTESTTDSLDLTADNSASADAGTNTHDLPVSFLKTISARAPNGFFHIVSQISPNAAGNLEDLTLLDQTDPRQWLLLIITSDDEGNFSIYRRLIRDNNA